MDRPWLRRLEWVYAIGITGLVLGPAAWLAVYFDQWAGASLNPTFELVLISGGAALGAVAFALGRHWMYLITPAAFVLFMAVLPLVDLGPVKPAVRAVDEIRPGMNKAQVRGILDRHFPEHGRFKKPEIFAARDDVLIFALDPTDGRYNAALVEIKFSEGRCTSAEFLAD